MSDRAYALRFISGKYQGGEYPLSDAGELLIGRSSEQDMVLIEDMVSRKHAKLTLAADQIVIAMMRRRFVPRPVCAARVLDAGSSGAAWSAAGGVKVMACRGYPASLRVTSTGLST